MILGSELIKNTLLRLNLSFSDSKSHFKDDVCRALTLERKCKFLAQIKKVVKICEMSDLRVRLN